MLSTSHGLGISARAHVQTALLYLRNGLADWVQFWCVSWGSWARCLPQVMDGVSLHVHTCRPRFCISGTAWPIVFKFGMGGWASLSTCFPQVRGGMGHLCTCARAPPSPCLRIRVANCTKIWCVAGDPIVRDLQESEVGWLHIRTCVCSFVVSETAESWHWSHTKNKLTYLFRARSFIAKHGVLLV